MPGTGGSADPINILPPGHFHGSHKDFSRVNSAATRRLITVLPKVIVSSGILNQVKELPVRPTDVFVTSFPKSGTSWLQEIVYLIKTDLDFKSVSEALLEDRVPLLESWMDPSTFIDQLISAPSPRLIKSHMPYDLLPRDVGQVKTVFIYRNPKDMLVSYYHFNRMLSYTIYKGTFEDYLEDFISDRVPYTPFFEHLESYLERRWDPNLLILTYEELSKEPAAVIKRIGTFLERPLTDSEAESIVAHTSFGNMAKNPTLNKSHWDRLGMKVENETAFFRKGKVGDWKNHFHGEAGLKVDAWIQRKNTRGYVFCYE